MMADERMQRKQQIKLTTILSAFGQYQNNIPNCQDGHKAVVLHDDGYTFQVF